MWNEAAFQPSLRPRASEFLGTAQTTGHLKSKKKKDIVGAQTRGGPFLVPQGQQLFGAFAQRFLMLWNYTATCRRELRQMPEHHKDAAAAPNITREIWCNRNPSPPLLLALQPENQHNCISRAKDKLKRRKQNKIISSSLYHKMSLKQ